MLFFLTRIADHSAMAITLWLAFYLLARGFPSRIALRAVVVLHDAYVEGVPNREIMARLYISEGTFIRTRRSALPGLARLLLEKEKAFSERNRSSPVSFR